MRHIDTIIQPAMLGIWSQGNRPEETVEKVREQLRKTGARLIELADQHELSDSIFEGEIRLQACWVSCSANAYAQAAMARARMAAYSSREAVRLGEDPEREEGAL